MIVVKQREYPIIIPMLEVLLIRLPARHKKMLEIKDAYLKEKAGYAGEKRLDFFLEMLTSNNFYNLQGVRLKQSGKFFQMDSLVICPSFIAIFEVKNWGGILRFDKQNNQVLQTIRNETKKLEDPTLQVRRHLRQLKAWFKAHNLKCPPILTMVVMANPDVLIEFDVKNAITEMIIYPDSSIEKVEEFAKIYQERVLSTKEINHINKVILENDTPKEYDVLRMFNLTTADLIPGVSCPKCGQISMIKKYKTWFCPDCKIHSSDAHEKNILDFLLINGSITNRQCREFLGLPAKYLNYITRTFTKMGLPYEGKTSNRIYYRQEINSGGNL